MATALNSSVKLLVLAVSAATLSTALPAQAMVTWGAATNLSGDADVAINGSYFDALTEAASALTVNTVNFNLANSSNSDAAITVVGPYGRGAFGTSFTTAAPSSANYSALVNSGAFGNFDSGTVTVGNGSAPLTVGDSYQVQVWSYYSGDVGGTTIYSGVTPVALANQTGQFAIGTFIATGTSESFTFSSASGHNFLNDVSVRDITPTGGGTVPEPASLSLLAVSGVAVCLRRRR